MLHSEADFKTAVKEKRDSERPEMLLQTPSLSKRHHYRPSNLKLISQHYRDKLQELQSKPNPDHFRTNPEAQLTFVIVARITSIHY